MTVYNGLFTSEAVSTGHPDKLCDRISDTILDAFLARDPDARVACECFAADDKIIVAGEFRARDGIVAAVKHEAEGIVRQVLRSAGYGDARFDIDPERCEVELRFNSQAAEIAAGVDGGAELGAGDQGIMVGYATRETEELMPLAWSLATDLIARGTELVNAGRALLRPDGKSQVTVRYVDGAPSGVEAIVLSWQHNPDADLREVRAFLQSRIIDHVIPPDRRTADCKVHLNPSGTFTTGGPKGDTGLTGRKIIVDTYGGAAPHGGGAFSGKDPSKVDRSAAYAARWVAKNVVGAGLADRATVQLAYAIGVAEPVSVNINTHGTGQHDDRDIEEAVLATFDLRPAAIIRRLDLKRPIYADTSALGHFGSHRDPQVYPWERLDRLAELRSAIRNTAEDPSWRLAKSSIRSAPAEAASDIFIEALMREYRTRWAVPGLMKLARSDHFAGCLKDYRAWHETVTGSRPSPLELTLVAEGMVEFEPSEARSREGLNPWVAKSDFPVILARAAAKLRNGRIPSAPAGSP